MLFFLNGSEFCQKLIGTIIRVLDPYEVKCHIRAQCAPLPPPMLPPECISSLFISISLLIVKSEYELQELSKLNNTSSFIINLVSSIRYIMSPPFCLTSLIMSFTWLSVGFCPIDLSTAVSS